MKKIEVNNKNKNKYRKLKTILYIWSLKRKGFQYVSIQKIKTDYVHIKECNNGDLTTGRLKIQW